MFSHLNALLDGASLATCGEIVAAIQDWQGLVHTVSDRCFVNGAWRQSVIQTLNDLATSNLIVEVELNELHRVFPSLTEEDLPVRMEWLRQDLRRAKNDLVALQERLITVEEPWARLTVAEIQRLLE